jgi:hypothetical protein
MHIVPADAKVEEDGGGHQGNVRAAECKSHFTIRQVAPDTGRGFEAKGAAPRQRDAVYAIGHVQRAEGVDLLCAAGAAANIHARDGALLAQNRGATGDGFEIRDMTDADARNVRQALHDPYGSIVKSGTDSNCWIF